MIQKLEMLSLLVIIGVICAIGNTIMQPQVTLLESLVGLMVLVILGALGYLIALLPIFNKLPNIFWVSIVAILTVTISPWADAVKALTQNIGLLAICTPILAYAGLAVGKDLNMFKKLSWKIIPVALAVFIGTFLFAAIIAEFTLRYEGVIS